MYKSLMHTFWRLIECWKSAGLLRSSLCEEHFRGSGAVFIFVMAKATVPEPFWAYVACGPQAAVTESESAGKFHEIPGNSERPDIWRFPKMLVPKNLVFSY